MWARFASIVAEALRAVERQDLVHALLERVLLTGEEVEMHVRDEFDLGKKGNGPDGGYRGAASSLRQQDSNL